VFAVGIGTSAGQPLHSQGFTLRVRLDEPTLRQVADLTGGAYFGIRTADALSGIYPKLSARLGFEQRYLEVSGLFALSAALIAALAALLAVHRHKRIL
jgi:Ca-activated chloride channel family protein